MLTEYQRKRKQLLLEKYIKEIDRREKKYIYPLVAKTEKLMNHTIIHKDKKQQARHERHISDLAAKIIRLSEQYIDPFIFHKKELERELEADRKERIQKRHIPDE